MTERISDTRWSWPCHLYCLKGLGFPLPDSLGGPLESLGRGMEAASAVESSARKEKLQEAEKDSK